MASLRRLPGTKFFIGCYTDANGRRCQRSTKCTDRKSALKIVTAWEGVASSRATEAQTRRVLSSLHEQIHGTPLSSATVQSYADQWLARKKVETRAVTHAAYRGALGSFLGHLEAKKDQSIAYVTPATVAAWRDAGASAATPRTANNKLKVLRVFFQAAWCEGLLPDGNPAAKIKILATEESTRRPLTIPEIKRALAAADNQWKGMILAGLYSGQRLKDLAGLTWASVDLVSKQISFATSKTGRRQHIPIATPLLAYLEALPSTDDPKSPIFPGLHPYAIKANGSAALSQQFHDLLAVAGLVTARDANKQSTGVGRKGARAKTEISFHSLRHSATSLLKKAGVSESVAMDLIGHDSAAMSANYTHTDDDARRAAVESLPDITK
ncbi:MAG: tyrosine-type recombinase/integrase [Opitutus sp.]|nr:tyrosine-type recombinase/integrase [Opitutus sp.]MCS6246760.1 tyrosine-type recombinase/integrase [Opitutus sp.]MCS6273278.1 tyrosine-type recombinase/integrase [Opitutus sp.]MCS6276184.1 tyrosine-type recombinase/integrase [Opitutus sp.]MCS6301278.1 tyrosine-type recombinase/integrase [Opitutus sp.]